MQLAIITLPGGYLLCLLWVGLRHKAPEMIHALIVFIFESCWRLEHCFEWVLISENLCSGDVCEVVMALEFTVVILMGHMLGGNNCFFKAQMSAGWRKIPAIYFAIVAPRFVLRTVCSLCFSWTRRWSIPLQLSSFILARNWVCIKNNQSSSARLSNNLPQQFASSETLICQSFLHTMLLLSAN